MGYPYVIHKHLDKDIEKKKRKTEKENFNLIEKKKELNYFI